MGTMCSENSRAARTFRRDPAGPLPKYQGTGLWSRLLQRAWWVMYYTLDFLVASVGLIPFHCVRMFFYKYVFRMKIGDKTSIHSRCRFYSPRAITIGRNTIVNNDILLDGRAGLHIGNNVSISEGTAVFTLEHDLDSPDFASRGGPVQIHDYVFIGARAIILPGIILGKGSAVGAGSVVTRDVEPYAIVAGVPARLLRYRSTDLCYNLNYKKLFG
jgi:acetyltransferase-like isoleucine patch superfamily enzyme